MIRRDLRDQFEQTLEEKVDRFLEVKAHPIVPAHHFSSPSRECAEVYLEGKFFSAISLTQAIVDSISRFIFKRNDLKADNDVDKRLRQLEESNLVSSSCVEAMKRIWIYRHDFHHLNPTVPTNVEQLKEIASANRVDLALIEGEIFAFEIVNGAIAPRKPKYWDIQPGGIMRVDLRLHLQ